MNQQALEETLKYFQSLTPEQYAELLGLKKGMTQELFDKVINQVNQGQIQDGTDVWDFPHDLNFILPITSKEFKSVHSYIKQYTLAHHPDNIYDYSKIFPCYRIYFEYNNYYYIWESAFGQGSVSSLSLGKDDHPTFILTIDPNIEFST